MSQVMPHHFRWPLDPSEIVHNPGYQAYQILHVGFVVAPIVLRSIMGESRYLGDGSTNDD